MPLSARVLEALAWAGAALGLAAIIGVATALDARLGIVLVLGLALAAGVVSRPRVVLPLLAASVFVEEVAIGGVTVSRLLAPVALAVVVAVALRRPLTLKVSAPLVWVGAYALWALASVAWTISADDTRFKLFSLAIALVYLVALAVLIESRQDLESVLLAIAVASLLTGAFGILTAALGVGGDLQGGRPNGGAGDPNLFAAYQIVALPITLALAATTRGRALRGLLVAAVVVQVASVFASQSRGGLIALTAVMLLILVLPARALFRTATQKGTVLVSIALAGAVALAATGAPLLGRLESVSTSDPTGSGRVFLWKAAGTSIARHPFLGVGYGSFPAAAPNLLRETEGVDFRHIEIEPDRKASEAHSAYVGTLAELGLPGLALFVLLLLAVAGHLVRTARRARRAGAAFVARIANALLLSLVGWSVASVFLSTESSRSLWTLIGVSLALGKLIGQPEAGVSKTARRYQA